MKNFEQRLVETVNGQKLGGVGRVMNLTEAEASKQGYWPVTKAVIEEVRATMKPGSRLLFSGFSQGGGTAQLARMYTEKLYGEKWPVITFGAVGSMCFPRELFGKGRTDLLDDVDPTVEHRFVTDYQNYLDPWVRSPLDPPAAPTRSAWLSGLRGCALPQVQLHSHVGFGSGRFAGAGHRRDVQSWQGVALDVACVQVLQ
jgi:hypothetical protein